MYQDQNITTLDDLNKLIGLYEFIRLEFKSSWLFYDPTTNSPKKGDYIDKLSKEISGFANTEGGHIIIGIETEHTEKEPEKAVQLDQGILFKDFSPETIQRQLEASISPPLPGLRFIHIKSEHDEKRYYLVIEVPKGNTAHQAKDKHYYGRSEFETIPLHDSVIRMLMTKSIEPHATVVLVEPGDYINEYKDSLEVYLENDGEINIKEFKLLLLGIHGDYRYMDDSDESFDLLYQFQPLSYTFRDGWPPRKGYWVNGIHKDEKYSEHNLEPVMVNIFPKDHFYVCNLCFTYKKDYGKYNSESILNWMLYLPNTRPIEGKINLNNTVHLKYV